MLVIQVTQFWVTIYGGLAITTKADLYNNEGRIVWSRLCYYRSRDFSVNKTIDEYVADQMKLLIKEIPFAADKIADDFIKDLKSMGN